MTKKVIKLKESDFKKIIKESLTMVLETISDDPLHIEDFFDINSLSAKDVKSIATDISVFFAGKGYYSNISDDGETIINENTNVTMPIGQLRQELKKLGFKNWQIKSQIAFNKVRVVILYADIAKNTNIIVNKMASCGWVKASVSNPKVLYGVPIRVMTFDPEEQKSLTKEARRYHYLYHWTPYKNLNSILNNGIEARSENDYLSYSPKAHLMKGDISKSEASSLGWKLFRMNNSLKDGHYALLRITMAKVPENIEFYGDSRYPYGYFTKETIPSLSLDLFGEIIYRDKFNYNNETINVLVANDTMTT